MVGFNLLRHSVRMISINKVEILKLGFIPMTLYAVAMIFLHNALPQNLNDASVHHELNFAELPWEQISIAVFVLIFSLIGFTVNWHRFVLLEEVPESWVTQFRISKILAYVFAVIKLSLLGMVFFVPVAFVLGFVGPIVGVFIVIAAVFFLSVFVTQLSIILPAVAIGAPLGIKKASEMMKGSYWTVFLIVLLIAIANFLVRELVILISNNGLHTFSMIVQIPIQLFLGLLNVSILTTLYGYYVEDRPI